MGFVFAGLGIFGIIALMTWIVGDVIFDKCKTIHRTAEYIISIIFSVSGIIAIAFAFSCLLFGIDYVTSSISYTKDTIKRDNLIRLVQEDYDPDNLKEALEFNAIQKQSAEFNKTIMWYCWKNCYVIDTIPIPTEKYFPSSMVKLDAVIEHLAEKAAGNK